MNKENGYLMKYATRLSIAVAILLIFVKAYTFHITNSVSLLSSLVDSFFDSIASVINLIAVHFSLLPATDRFRFGFGKAEALAGLLQSLFILLSMGYIIYESIQRFFLPNEVTHLDLAVYVTLGSLLLTAGLVRFQTYVIRKTDSLAIKADSLHYKVDIYMNAVVLISLFFSFYISFIDSIGALLISCYILWSLKSIFVESLNVLLDRELPEEKKHKIISIINDHPEIQGFHNLRTRYTNNEVIELHAEMDSHISLLEAHEIANNLKELLLEAFPYAEILIHQDPKGHDTHEPLKEVDS